MRRVVATLLFWICTALDYLPYFDRQERRWFHGCWGCMVGLSRFALRVLGPAS